MNKSETIKELATSLSAFQAEMPAVQFDSTNPFLKKPYASLGAIVETSRPLLAKHGLAVTQLLVSEGELIGVETVILHKSGEWMGSAMYLPTVEEKGKSDAQVAGSTITYLRRYAYASALGIYADADADGVKVTKTDWKPAIQPEIKPEAAPQSDNPFTLADALQMENSEHVPYGKLSSNKLAIMWKAMDGSIKKNHLEGDEKALREIKMKACELIRNAREAGEIADVA